MSNQILVTGTIDWFEDSTFTNEALNNYLLCPVLDTDQPSVQFRGGTAVLYGENPVYLFATGSPWDFGQGTVLVVTTPFGAFNDFAIWDSSHTDPLDGLVIAATDGATTGTVGNPWTRHYRVLLPPKTARFAVPHIKLGSVAAGNAQYLDGHQFEALNVANSAPSAFDQARSIQVYVRPTRLNYAVGSTTVPYVIPGRTYTASATVNGVRQSFQFVPTASTYTLTFTGGTPTKILVEEGTTVGTYFDGSTDLSGDYLWEQGGTPGASRSYYYPDRTNRHYVLVRNLQANAPLGTTVEAPVYATLPAPSSSA